MIAKRIIWHHTGDASEGLQFNNINEHHKKRGFPISRAGFYVGYHYLVEKNGDIRQAREQDEIGAHDQGENLDSIGLGLSGNFNTQMPTEVQTIGACAMLGEIMKALKIPITHIETHRRDDQTSCPGTNLPDNWLLKEYLRRHPHIEVKQFHLLGVHTGLL